MHVLMVSGFAPPMEGGSERYCFNLSKALVERGHKPEIWTSQHPKNMVWHEVLEGVPITRFRCFHYMLTVNPLVFFMRTLSREIHNFDLVHMHSYVFFQSNQIALLRFYKKFPFVLHLHGGLDYLPPNILGYKTTALKFVYDQTVGPFVMKMADKIVACCESDRQKAIQNFNVHPEKTVTVSNSIITRDFKATVNPDPMNIVFIGRFYKLKGVQQFPFIVDTICRRYGGEVRFVFVGNGVLQPLLKQYFSGNKQVFFCGNVPNFRVPEILWNASILILPSLSEGFPLVVLEALASAVPVVAYNIGGIGEVVKTNETGFLLPVGDVGWFIKAICYLIDNPTERKRMGLNGRKLILEKHDWKKHVDKILETYNEVTGL